MSSRSARRRRELEARMLREASRADPVILRRELVLEAPLTVRAAAGGERIIEGRIVPFGLVATVQDRDARTNAPVGRPYRETIEGIEGFDPSGIVLEQGHRGPIAGRGLDGREERDGAHVAFRMLGTAAGNDSYELAREGLASSLSIEIDPSSPSRRRPDGVIARRAIVKRVAIVDRGAYDGAAITAVRAGEDANMPPEATSPATPATGDTTPAGILTREEVAAMIAAAQPSQAAAGDSSAASSPQAQNMQRAAVERETVAGIAGRSAPARVTRDQLMYGPGSGQSFFGDGWRVAQRLEGHEEARERLERHYRFLEDVDLAIQRSVGFGNDGAYMGRAGDVLSSEIPGAYPSEYVPGLIVNRILKQRPLAGFYQRFPLTDGRPRIYPVVSTSTSVAVQGAEGSNPAASDFATTATTVTPLFYGGETKVSRQVLDGADPSTDAMLSTDLTEAYMQASETVVKTAVEAGSTASGVTLTAATPNIGLINLALNHLQNVFLPAERIFLPTTLTSSWLTQLDTTNRPLAPWLNPMNSSGKMDIDLPVVGQIAQTPVAQSWASTPGAGAGVGGVAIVGRSSDFAIFESNIVRFEYREGAEAPAAIRVGLWAYLVVGARRGSRKATGA